MKSIIKEIGKSLVSVLAAFIYIGICFFIVTKMTQWRWLQWENFTSNVALSIVAGLVFEIKHERIWR